MKFKAEDLRELIYGGGPENLRVISDNVTENTRWSALHRLVFEDETTGKFYAVNYSEGLTENQMEEPFEYEDEVECEEVRKTIKMVEVYVPVSEKSVKKYESLVDEL